MTSCLLVINVMMVMMRFHILAVIRQRGGRIFFVAVMARTSGNKAHAADGNEGEKKVFHATLPAMAVPELLDAQ